MEKTTVLIDEYSAIKNILLRLPSNMVKYKIYQLNGISRSYQKAYIYENDDKISSIKCSITISFNKDKFYGKVKKKGNLFSINKSPYF